MRIWLDAWLLAQTQVAIDKLLAYFGQTKFWLQRWLITCWMGTMLAEKLSITPVIPAHLLPHVLVAAVLIGGEWFLTSRHEQEFLRSASVRKSLVHEWQFRHIALMFTAINIAFIPLDAVTREHWVLDLLVQLFFVTWVYVAACTPRPPGKSRLMRKLKQLRDRLHQSTLPAAEPTPT